MALYFRKTYTHWTITQYGSNGIPWTETVLFISIQKGIYNKIR